MIFEEADITQQLVLINNTTSDTLISGQQPRRMPIYRRQGNFPTPASSYGLRAAKLRHDESAARQLDADIAVSTFDVALSI